jgi:cellulose synthase/poly-beta-1,6-N-acetylglucosamine synthase-like glycosyltransferase
MAAPVIILLLIIYAYSLLILLFYLEIEKDPDTASVSKAQRSVSVVVPFRNEEDHLPGLLEDFSRQSYPSELMEIIFVDDHSMDDSASLLTRAISNKAHFRYLALPPHLSGKKKALSHGIQQALHERIIQVDADCRLDSGFISAHMAFLDRNPSDLVAGMLTTWKEKGSLLEIFDRLEILALIGSGAGSFGLGRPMMCSGANLSYSRELYWETRPFDPEEKVASGDDMFLMIGARKLGRSLAFISNRESIVRTSPQRDLRALLVQRIRWGAKAGMLKMPDIQLLGVLVSLTNFAILLMPLWLVLFSAWWPWLAGAWVFKTLADFLLLFKMTGICGSRSDLKMFLPASFLYYPYYLLLVLGALLRKPEWKSLSEPPALHEPEAGPDGQGGIDQDHQDI